MAKRIRKAERYCIHHIISGKGIELLGSDVDIIHLTVHSRSRILRSNRKVAMKTSDKGMKQI
jgi:hypothetical protein